MNTIRLFFSIVVFFASYVSYGQTFDDIAKRLCDENKKGFVIFGKNGKLSNLVSSQPELKNFIVYECDYKSEIGKRFGVSSPTMYALNKNMVVEAKEELSSKGWKEMKKQLKFRLSEDCILIARPTEVELMAVVQPMTHKELETQLIEDSKEEKAEVETTFVQNKIVPEEQQYWTVQLGAYNKEENAYRKMRNSTHVELEMNVRKKYLILNGEYKEFYVVYAGLFADRTKAKQWADTLNGFVYEIQ